MPILSCVDDRRSKLLESVQQRSAVVAVVAVFAVHLESLELGV